jgi:chromosome segregation ATPase
MSECNCPAHHLAAGVSCVCKTTSDPAPERRMGDAEAEELSRPGRLTELVAELRRARAREDAQERELEQLRTDLGIARLKVLNTERDHEIGRLKAQLAAAVQRAEEAEKKQGETRTDGFDVTSAMLRSAREEAERQRYRAEDAEERAESAEALVREFAEALEGFRYSASDGRFCDHAAEPCDRCDRARLALARVSEKGKT